MKKNYIAPTSQFRMMAAQQMMALSIVDGGTDGNNNAQSKNAGEEGDALVKNGNLWDTEW